MLLLNYGTYKYLYKREYIVRSNGYKLKICSGIWTDRGSNISGVYCENLFCFPILRLIYRKSGNRKIQVEYQINQHYTYTNALNSNYLMEHEVYLCTCQYVSALEKYIFVTHVFSFFRQSVQRLKSINAYNNQSTSETYTFTLRIQHRLLPFHLSYVKIHLWVSMDSIEIKCHRRTINENLIVQLDRSIITTMAVW